MPSEKRPSKLTIRNPFAKKSRENSTESLSKEPPPPAPPSIVDPPPTTIPDVKNPYLSEANDPVPRKVACKLVVFYDDKRYDHFEPIWVKWLGSPQYKATTYRDIEGTAVRILKERVESDAVRSTTLYRKSGRCRLIRGDVRENAENETEADTQILETEKQWGSVLPLMIAKFCANNQYVAFFIEIRWEYSGLTIEKIPNQRYAMTVQRVVYNKMRINWEDKKFLPRKDLKNIFTESTVRELIESDSSLKEEKELCSWLAHQGRPMDRETFKSNVVARGTRLLALCVYVDMSLDCLYRLMDGSVKDARIPLDRTVFPPEVDPVKLDTFMLYQGGFKVYDFLYTKGEPKHENIPKEVVVPIMFDEKEDMRGKGAFGEVFAVKIHPDHHTFSADRDVRYALKRFLAHGDRTQQDFQNEANTLRTLSQVPHPNITPHLASWTQNGRFYMLFPLAENNLKSHLRTPSPDLTKEFVMWLLRQLRDLTAAVEHIHILGPSGLGVSDNLQVTNRVRTGFHHDLKPENILIFAGDETSGRILKISDFGTAKINTVLSGSGVQETYKNLNPTHGDLSYGAPDWAQDGMTSRPYDIWSLGCIFLEVLLWTFGFGGQHLEGFEVQRLMEAGSGVGTTAAYWYRDSNQRVSLKPSVIKKLQDLQVHCENRGVFRDLVTSTARMLTIRPKQRPTAPTVRSQVHAMGIQARFDLKDPNFYQDNVSSRAEFAAPASAPYRTSSRSASIDNRSVDAPYDISEKDRLSPISGGGHVRSFSDPTQTERPSWTAAAQGSDPQLYGSSLAPIDTNVSVTVSHRNRSPSISITAPDGGLSDSHPDDSTSPDIFQARALIGAHQVPIPLEEIRGRQSRSHSGPAVSDSDSDTD